MSSPFRMMASLTSVIIMIIGVYFLFFNTAMDDHRTSSIRQITTASLNKKAVRNLPQTNNSDNQIALAHYSLDKTTKLPTNWSTSSDVNEYEQAVWSRINSEFGNKISKTLSKKENNPTFYQLSNSKNLTTITRQRTWSENGVEKGTLIFTYLCNDSLEDVYAVKTQAMVSGNPYTINLSIVHDNSNNNFGSYTPVSPLQTAQGTIDTTDHKSGETIGKTYTSDKGYNVVWDTEFVQPLKYKMDHIRVTYTFNQTGQTITIPNSLDKIFTNMSNNDMPVKVLQSNTGKTPYDLSRDQVKIENATNNSGLSKLTLTLTPDQSAEFFNVSYDTQEKLLFRVFTQINNGKLTNDYVSGQAKLETLDKDNNVLQSQTTNLSKVRVTPFAVQPIDTKISLNSMATTLTHYANRLYGSNDDDSKNNTSYARIQYKFAKDGNELSK